MSELARKTCVPCKTATPPLKREKIDVLLKELSGGWQAINDHHLEKDFRFKNFADALAFTSKVGAVAEEEGHHPDISLSWGLVKIRIWTHKIHGLTESDFVLAAKIDEIR
jgi:4a-hydroxytetrahydrobiopterin dehydratase